jgi:WD40 repeat protein/tetratricopeptide (TPR) repeat protein/tRNA A-37 threonylcarbamoyl transferase component Bud32
MGVVYKARQVALGRLVALKMIRAGDLAEQQELARFRAEAAALARVQHPHIVQIHEIGERDGQPYFALEYVAGGNLARKLAGAPQTARWATELLVTLARAVDAAHRQHVVHRDLKPANVLLTADGTPKITDFGLAKRLDACDDRTRTGQILGTPSYMAPEQAAGRTHDIGPRTDVYAMGAILYEVVTGRPPFRAANVLDTVEQVRHSEPVPPSRLHPKLPRDLETICLKCLHKDPRQRYDSARALADDLERFLRGEPIQARPVGRLERLLRWCRRYPARAAAAALVIVLLSAAVVVPVLFAVQQENHARALGDALLTSEGNRRQAEYQLAESYLDRGLVLCERGDIGAGILWLARGLEIAPLDAADLARVIRTNLASWRPLLHTPVLYLEAPAAVHQVAFSPNGQTILAGLDDGTARLFDVATGAAKGELRHDRAVHAVAFSPDGKTILTGSADGAVQTWDAATGKSSGAALLHDDAVHAVAFHPDGKQVLTACADKMARLWDLTARKAIGSPWPHPAAVVAVAFSPDGTMAVTASDRAVRLWETATGKRLHEFALTNVIAAVAYSPDGKRIAANDGFNTLLWDAKAKSRVGRDLHHFDWVSSIAFSPDGRLVLTGGGDFAARLWNSTTGEAVTHRVPHRTRVKSVAFAPDGRSFVTADGGPAIRVWQVSTGTPARVSLRRRAASYWAVFSPDGTRILNAHYGTPPQLWDIATGDLLATVHAAKGIARLAFYPDGTKFVTVTSEDGQVQWWDTATKKPLALHATHPGANLVVVSGDGRIVVTGGWQTNARLWDATTGQLLGELAPNVGMRSVAISPDGRLVLIGADDPTIRLWDRATCRPLDVPLATRTPAYVVAFSRDGTRAVAGTHDGSTLVWDTKTWQLIGRSPQHAMGIWAADVSPDGKTVLTGSRDRTARLWDIATGKPLTPPLPHLDEVFTVAFHPSGRRAFTGSGPEGFLWTLPAALDDPVDRIALGVQVLSGMRLEENGTAAALDARDWHDCCDRLQGLGAPRSADFFALSWPDALAWHELQAGDCEAAQQWDAAIFHRKRLIELAPGDWRHWQYRGTDHRMLRRLPEAVADYSKAIELQPNRARRWLSRAIAYHDLRELDKAVRDCDRALELDPNLAHAWCTRGYCQRLRGHLDEALADGKKATELDPHDGYAWYTLGLAYRELGQWREAVAALSAAMAIDPNGWATAQARGDAHEHLHQWDQAIADYTRSLERFPTNVWALTRRGYCHAQCGDTKAAHADFDQAIMHPPGYAWPRCLRAELLLLEGNEKAFRAECMEVKSAVARPGTAPENLRRAALLGCLLPDGAIEPERLVRMAQDALAAQAELPAASGAARDRDEYLTALGAALFRAGRYPDALARLREAIDIHGNDRPPLAHVFLAMVYQRRHDNAAARGWLTKATAAMGARSTWNWDQRLKLQCLLREAEKLLAQNE